MNLNPNSIRALIEELKSGGESLEGFLQPFTVVMPVWMEETLTPEGWLVLGCPNRAEEIWWNSMPERGIL